MTTNLKVVELLPKDSNLYQDIIQLLEDVIRRAKSGDIFAVGIVSLHQDQSVGTAWSIGAEEQMHKFIGGIESLKYRAIKELMED
jgi:hypothetical protein